MADDRVYHDPETGQNYLRTPTNEFVPIDPDQVEIAQETGGESFRRTLGDTVAALPRGLSALFGGEQARAELEQAERDRQLRREFAAGPVLGGTVAGYAPDVAAGVLTGGGSVAGSIARGAAVEAALGAIRTPDAPLQGAAVQGAFGAAGGALGPAAAAGARAMTRGARKGAQLADDMFRRTPRDRSLSAAQRAGDDLYEGEPALRGMLTPEELDELSADFGAGRLYTPGDERALRARVGTGQLGRADAQRQLEELSRRDILSDRAMGRGRSINEIRAEGEGIATQVVMRELGETQGERLTFANMNRLREEVGAKFDEVAEAAGDLQFSDTDMVSLDDALVKASADDQALISRFVERIQDDIEDGVLSAGKAQQYRTRLSNDATQAAQAGRYERAQSLGQVQDVLDDIVERQIPPDVAETLSEARYQWRIIKALERSTATTNAGGEVNLRSFLTAYQRRGNRGLRSSGATEQGEKFARTLETLRYLTERVTPSSGTGETILANLGRTGTGAAAAAIGGGALLGN